MTEAMMIVSTLNELRAARAILDEPVGLVPTMGFLHEGHLSLVKRAKEECASVVVSIFVNPTQFGPSEDLAAYPRDMERDLHLLEPLGVNLVWNPSPEIMYPDGYQTWVEVETLTSFLEGARRPGHFRGVTTVVSKLFNGVQPAKAYFGQKDAQQAAVIRRMTRDLNFPMPLISLNLTTCAKFWTGRMPGTMDYFDFHLSLSIKNLVDTKLGSAKPSLASCNITTPLK